MNPASLHGGLAGPAIGSPPIDYFNHQRFVPVLTQQMYEHWRDLLQATGRSREDFAEGLEG